MGHGVQADQNGHAGAFGQLAHRVHHGGGVHPQLHTEADGNGQVAVFGGQAGHNDAHAQAQHQHFQQQHRQVQQPDGKMHTAWVAHRKEHPEAQEHHQLNAEVQQRSEHLADGHRQPGKVHLAHHPGVGHKGIGGVVDAVCKQGPHRVACHIEEETGYTVGGNVGNAGKDHVEDDGGDQRVQQHPGGA